MVDFFGISMIDAGVGLGLGLDEYSRLGLQPKIEQMHPWSYQRYSCLRVLCSSLLLCSTPTSRAGVIYLE